MILLEDLKSQTNLSLLIPTKSYDSGMEKETIVTAEATEPTNSSKSILLLCI